MGSDSKSVNASNSGGSSWYVLDKVGNSDLAADFLKETFASSDDLMNDLVPAINLVSTLKSASSSENYSTPSEFFGGQEIFKDFAKWTEEIPRKLWTSHLCIGKHNGRGNAIYSFR